MLSIHPDLKLLTGLMLSGFVMGMMVLPQASSSSQPGSPHRALQPISLLAQPRVSLQSSYPLACRIQRKPRFLGSR